MKLSREQIIQALEFCGICECNNEKTNTECALIHMPFCKNYLRQQSLALIKELTEESQKWQEAYDCVDSACCELSSKCDELTEENERLKFDINTIETFLQKQRETEHKEHMEMMKDLQEIYEGIKYIKADTVQKMQERLKGYLREVADGDIDTSWIDQIAEEMLEENK